MEIPVTYVCWGCGSEMTTLEEHDLEAPALGVWNLCPDCQRKGKEEAKHDVHHEEQKV